MSQLPAASHRPLPSW
uniref:Uncharacterized protein n=1 Tax=Anguilla anguilla TaxID=7936 RepID=A0A0E9TD19_ANGAN